MQVSENATACRGPGHDIYICVEARQTLPPRSAWRKRSATLIILSPNLIILLSGLQHKVYFGVVGEAMCQAAVLFHGRHIAVRLNTTETTGTVTLTRRRVKCNGSGDGSRRRNYISVGTMGRMTRLLYFPPKCTSCSPLLMSNSALFFPPKLANSG